MLLWRNSIRVLECCIKRHTFDSITNSRKLVQKLSSEQFFLFFENIKIESKSRFLKYYVRVYQR